ASPYKSKNQKHQKSNTHKTKIFRKQREYEIGVSVSKIPVRKTSSDIRTSQPSIMKRPESSHKLISTLVSKCVRIKPDRKSFEPVIPEKNAKQEQRQSRQTNEE